MDKGSGSGIFPDPDPVSGDPKRPDPDPQYCFINPFLHSQSSSRLDNVGDNVFCIQFLKLHFLHMY